MKTFAIVLALCFFSAANTLQAGSATWRPHPNSNDWNAAANWRPRTVPNAATDTASFVVSDTVDVSLTADTIVGQIVFRPRGSAFTITTDPGSLSFSGTGIVNHSGFIQSFAANELFVPITFYNQATAGTQTFFTADNLGAIVFYDESSAGSGAFLIKGTETFQDGISTLDFYGDSSASDGIFINGGGTGYDGDGGATFFNENSTAANGAFTNMPGTYERASGGGTVFADDSNASHGVITNKGAEVSGGAGGLTVFSGNAAAGNATIIAEGAQVAGAYGGGIDFFETANAATATLVAKGGLDEASGGSILFYDTSGGSEARVELFGNGSLYLALLDSPTLTIGSLEGDGIVLLDIRNLVVGSNNLSTVFGGVIQDAGGITKEGSGTLTLTEASTYTGGTTVSGGFLKVSNRTGSATGTGAVQVDAGTLGGSGIISGAVTVGSGSGSGGFLAPGTGATTLTLQSSLTFKADGTYIWRFRTSSAKTDKVIANGVTIESDAKFDPVAKGNTQLAVGTTFIVISNTAATPIAGTFTNLADGGTVTVGSNTFQADYQGGDGNDLTLTVVP